MCVFFFLLLLLVRVRKEKKNSGTKCAYILAKMMKYRNEDPRNKPVELGEKIDRSRSRFGREDGSTSPSDPASRMVAAAHASMAAFLLFFRSFFFSSLIYLSLFLSPSLSHPCTALRPTLSHGKRSLYSLVVGRLG